MQRTVGGGSKGGGVVGGCRFLLSTPSVHIKSSFVRVERMSSAVHVVGLSQSVSCLVFHPIIRSVFNFPMDLTFAH